MAKTSTHFSIASFISLRTKLRSPSFSGQDKKNLSAIGDGLSEQSYGVRPDLVGMQSHIPSDRLSAEKEVSHDTYPSEEVIKNILNFSKALKIEKSRQMGLIEIVLN